MLHVYHSMRCDCATRPWLSFGIRSCDVLSSYFVSFLLIIRQFELIDGSDLIVCAISAVPECNSTVCSVDLRVRLCRSSQCHRHPGSLDIAMCYSILRLIVQLTGISFVWCPSIRILCDFFDIFLSGPKISCGTFLSGPKSAEFTTTNSYFFTFVLLSLVSVIIFIRSNSYLQFKLFALSIFLLFLLLTKIISIVFSYLNFNNYFRFEIDGI